MKALITHYKDHQNMFEIGSGEKATSRGYGKDILLFQLLNGIVITPRVINSSWTLDLDNNLLSTISLGKKEIQVFLRRTGQLSKAFFEDEVVGLANMIDNQYVIRLAKPSILKVNVMKNLTH